MCYRRSILGFLFLAIMGTIGCGGRGDVSGKVTYRGQPVVIGSVVMIGKDKKPVTGNIENDGSYSLKNVPAGDVQVAVVSPDPSLPAKMARSRAFADKLKAKGKAGTKEGREELPMPPLASNELWKKWVPLPEEVEGPETSGITTTIRAGDNVFDIELK